MIVYRYSILFVIFNNCKFVCVYICIYVFICINIYIYEIGPKFIMIRKTFFVIYKIPRIGL